MKQRRAAIDTIAILKELCDFDEGTVLTSIDVNTIVRKYNTITESKLSNILVMMVSKNYYRSRSFGRVVNNKRIVKEYIRTDVEYVEVDEVNSTKTTNGVSVHQSLLELESIFGSNKLITTRYYSGTSVVNGKKITI